MIITLTEEQIKEIKGCTVFTDCHYTPATWPQEGDKYWYVYGDGEVSRSMWACDRIDKDRLKQNNVFQTKEAAEMESLRRESRTGYIPEGEFWMWCYVNNKAFKYSSTLVWLEAIMHPTKEACEEWAKKYSKAWNYLMK